MRRKKVSLFFVSTLLVTSLFVEAAFNPQQVGAKSKKNITENFDLDTDGDGLKDFYELFNTNTKDSDSDKNGVLDGDEDYDGDGLTNLEEQELGTRMDKIDSDGDGLDDKEEIDEYGTKPDVADTDGDGLKDGIEIKYLKFDPLKPDENDNDIPDGEEEHEYKFPRNEFEIEGTMVGTFNVPQKVIVRDTPILLMQQIEDALVFDIVSLDPTIEFNLEIPVEVQSKKEDFLLLKYNHKEVQLETVKKQKFNKKSETISATFEGGGTFVVLSSNKVQENGLSTEGKKTKFKKFNGKARINNLPLELDGKDFTENGTFKISKIVKFKDEDSLDNEILSDKNLKEKDEVVLEATYIIDEMYEENETMVLSASAVTLQSGKTPVILVHGLFGGADTWGFEDRWVHNFYDEPWAGEPIRGYETITGTSYPTHTESTYSNIDVHSITGIVNDEELGSKLIIEYGYTPNEDIFAFVYNATGVDGTVRVAANHLEDVITDLKNEVFSSRTQDVNLVGHSMGGLVSRYLVENISRADVERVITLGTPHFGSDQAPDGDLSRDNSELWNGSRSLDNDFTKPMIAFAGWNPSYRKLVDPDFGDIRNIYGTGLGVGPNRLYSSWYDYVQEKYYDKTGEYPTRFDIGDGNVNIDSALGSDYDPDYSYNEDPVLMNRRFLIWDDEFGGHSSMRLHPRVPHYVERALTGDYDDDSKD